MSKELNFYDGNDTIKYQDNTSSLKLFVTEDGLPYDLTRLDAITLKFGNENGYLFEQSIDVNAISNPESGLINVDLDKDLVKKLVPDDYDIELWTKVNPIQYESDANFVNITIDNEELEDKQAIFPSEGNLVMTVDDNIKSSGVDVINAYPVDTVFNTVENWKNTATKIVQDALTKYLEAEIRTWQGDISTELKNELVNDLMTKSNEIKDTIQNVLGHSLSDELTKQAGDIKTQLETDVRNEMVQEVANRLADLKPIVENELHTNISSELEAEIKDFEQKTDTELNEKLAKDIVDKTNIMKNDISNDLKEILNNYFAKYINDTNADIQSYKDRIDSDLANFKSGVKTDFDNYKNDTTNSLNSTLTSITDKAKEDLLNNIQDKFTNEDSQIRKDLSEQVKTTLTKQVDDSLHEMQVNGSIAVSKADFDNFVNKINGYVDSLKIASNINEIIDGMKNDLQSVKDDTAKLSSKIDVLSGSKADKTDLDKIDLSSAVKESKDYTDTSSSQVHSQISSDLNNAKSDLSKQIEDLSDKSLSYKGTISSGNMDNSLSAGIYRGSGILESLKYKGDFQLIVYPTDPVFEEIFLAFDIDSGVFRNEKYTRVANGSSWKEWKKNANSDDTNKLNDKINDLSTSKQDKGDYALNNDLNSTKSDLSNKINDLSPEYVSGGAKSVDFDTLTDTKDYIMNWVSGNNCPRGMLSCNGFLRVLRTRFNVYQMFYEIADLGQTNILMRTAVNGHWTKWNRIATDKDLDQLHSQISSDVDNKISNLSGNIKSNDTVLTENDDLNNFDTFKSNAVYLLRGKAPVNAPSDLATNPYGSLTTYGDDLRTQIIVTDNIWYRTLTKNWNTGWKKATNTVQIVNNESELDSNAQNGTIAIIR